MAISTANIFSKVIVDYFKRVLSIEGGYFATINDKTFIKHSNMADLLKNNQLRTGPGDENNFIELRSTCYHIADGGF